MCVCLFQGNYGSLNFPTHTVKGFPPPPPLSLRLVAKSFYWLPRSIAWCKTGDLALQVFKPACTHDSLARTSIWLCLCMCLWGVWCNNAGSASCCVIQKSLLSCHMRIHTTPGFHIIKSDWSDIGLLIRFEKSISFGDLIRSTGGNFKYQRKIVLKNRNLRLYDDTLLHFTEKSKHTHNVRLTHLTHSAIVTWGETCKASSYLQESPRVRKLVTRKVCRALGF